MNKVEALAKHIGCEPIEIEVCGDCEFTVYRDDYLVCTDKEADDLAEECIEQSLWAFRAGFLSYWTGMDEEAIAAIQHIMNERCTGVFRKMLADKWDNLVGDAIAADGRGHFLNSCDGEEYEEGGFFIYKR